MATECCPDTPAQTETTIGAYHFSSRFDSGNMAKVEATTGMADEFDVWTAPDCAGMDCEQPYRTWFHFSVSGGLANTSITINIKNMNPQGKLYNGDMRPIYKVVPQKAQWARLKSQVSTSSHEQEEGPKLFQIRFKYRFEQSGETVFFAFCFPWSYAETQEMIHQMNEKYRNSSSIYYHHDVMAKSLDGRNMDLITITSHDGALGSSMPDVEGCFPGGGMRAVRFRGKTYFLLSSRVHPGETPASYVFNGFLDFILRENDPRAVALRKNFVFVLVPMINPDGVARGHYRVDTNGINLNRIYDNPCRDLHPTVYALKNLILSLHETVDLQYCVDLHGHATKKGCFIYGNSLDFERQVTNLMFPKLISMNSAYFDFGACNFSEKNMKMKDKRDNGLTKETCGRVVMYRETNMIHIYTLECNYNTGKTTNTIHAASGDGSGRASPMQPGRKECPKYTMEMYMDVGKGMAVALLDMQDINPWSRVKKSDMKNLEGVRTWVLNLVKGNNPARERLGLSLERRMSAKDKGEKDGSHSRSTTPRRKREKGEGKGTGKVDGAHRLSSAKGRAAPPRKPVSAKIEKKKDASEETGKRPASSRAKPSTISGGRETPKMNNLFKKVSPPVSVEATAALVPLVFNQNAEETSTIKLHDPGNGSIPPRAASSEGAPVVSAPAPRYVFRPAPAPAQSHRRTINKIPSIGGKCPGPKAQSSARAALDPAEDPQQGELSGAISFMKIRSTAGDGPAEIRFARPQRSLSNQ